MTTPRLPIVRVGNTVRRPAGPWTESVHELLRVVRARGVAWVPEPYGYDELGREVLGFIDGDVPAYPMPDWVWSDSVLAAAARLLRQLHDASVDVPRAGRSWRLPEHEPDEVICHNDFAPYNFVFREGQLHGVIDFDAASPGPRVWDVAYLAYRLVPLTAASNPDVPASAPEPRARRLSRLCAEYGAALVTPAEVLAKVPDRLDGLAEYATRHSAREDAGIYRTDAAHIRSHAAELLAR